MAGLELDAAELANMAGQQWQAFGDVLEWVVCQIGSIEPPAEGSDELQWNRHLCPTPFKVDFLDIACNAIGVINRFIDGLAGEPPREGPGC